MSSFVRLTLRTHQVDSARSFYAALLGDTPLDVVELHEQAVARGARPHWLGHIGVDDLDRATAAFAARGATALGPKMKRANLELAVLRDPGGAIVALAESPAAEREQLPSLGPEVGWYVLNIANVQRAATNYGELFGWEIGPPQQLDGFGLFHAFAWQAGGRQAGVMADVAERPGVHPHWLYHFPVDALDRALDLARDAGAIIAGTYELSNGKRAAVCDDPQGAAFALVQR